MNPRRPTPADLESAPFDPLGHPRQVKVLVRGYKCRYGNVHFHPVKVAIFSYWG